MAIFPLHAAPANGAAGRLRRCEGEAKGTEAVLGLESLGDDPDRPFRSNGMEQRRDHARTCALNGPNLGMRRFGGRVQWILLF